MSERQEIEDLVKCPDCGSRSLTRDESRGEVSCDDCGLVIEDNVIDQGAEWRVFSPEQGDQRARTGAPMTVMLHDKGLSTDIDWQNKDYSGKTINSRYRSQFYRMRKWQKRSRVSNATERNLAMALAELDSDGLMKLLFRKDNGEVLGAHIYGLHAADLIQEVANAVARRQTVLQLAYEVHTHPTLSEVVEVAYKQACKQVCKPN